LLASDVSAERHCPDVADHDAPAAEAMTSAAPRPQP